jgi:hypothetical protein
MWGEEEENGKMEGRHGKRERKDHPPPLVLNMGSLKHFPCLFTGPLDAKIFFIAAFY